MFQTELLESKGLAGKVADNYQIIKEARIKSLEEILDFVKVNNTERLFFDKNGNRDIYDRFRED